MHKPDIATFIEEADLHHPTNKFTAEISDTETQLYTKAQDSTKNQSLMLRHILKKTEAFQYTHFTSCHPPSVRKGLPKGKPLESYEQTPQKLRLRIIFQI